MGDGERVLGEYVLLEVIGRGPASTVHRARLRDRSGRIVAVKHLHVEVSAQAVERLRRQSAALAELDHPAIAPLLDVVDAPDGTVALVSAYAAGGSLQDVLAQRGRLPWWRVAHLGERLASALAAAHAAGIVHGEVTAANVLLDARQNPWLTDFGAAALRDDGHRDRGDPSAAGDLHDLGVLLQRALGDQSRVPGPLAAAVELATARQPAYRFASAEALRRALAPFASLDEPTQPHALGVATPDAPRRPWARLVGAGLAVLALVVAGLWVAGWGDEEPPRGTPTSIERMEEARPRQPPARCTGVGDPVEEGQVLEADVDGRGCALPVLVTEEVVDDEPTIVVMLPPDAGAMAGRYAVGEGGDHVIVVVGDWDCDGTDTPAVVHGHDGEVFQFDGYGELDPTRAPSLPADVDPRVMTDEEGCDHVTG